MTAVYHKTFSHLARVYQVTIVAGSTVLRQKGCDFIVVPNNLTPANIWQQPWGGYDPGPMPADVDEADVGRLTEGEAWLKYALAGRLMRAGATHGLHVYFRGQVWDLGSDGRTIYIDNQTITRASHVPGASVTNIWL